LKPLNPPTALSIYRGNVENYRVAETFLLLMPVRDDVEPYSKPVPARTVEMGDFFADLGDPPAKGTIVQALLSCEAEVSAPPGELPHDAVVIWSVEPDRRWRMMVPFTRTVLGEGEVHEIPRQRVVWGDGTILVEPPGDNALASFAAWVEPSWTR